MLVSGVDLILPEAQALEVADILQREFHVSDPESYVLLEEILRVVEIVTTESLQSFENTARKRLDKTGQRDWPVLAAAIKFDAHIWSNDRDFFGVGVAAWTTLNVPFALEAIA